MYKGFVFDLDDTLMDNVHDYSEPILEATKLIIDALGYRAPHVAQIVSMIQEIDLSRRNQIDPTTGAHYGYSKRRFPGSLVETYRAICQRINWQTFDEIEKELEMIGLSAFSEVRYTRNIKHGAVELLRRLITEKDGIAILTKGDAEVQKLKIDCFFRACRERGCNTSLIQVRIVDTEKSPGDFSEIKQGMPGCDTWYSVGNDYDKDIAPAIDVGFDGLWIPVETWESMGKLKEIKESRMNKSRCTEFESLNKILEMYEFIS